jgi:hypothetical protein
MYIPVFMQRYKVPLVTKRYSTPTSASKELILVNYFIDEERRLSRLTAKKE